MNTLWGAEAKANLTLGVRLGGRRHPQTEQAQRQEGSYLSAPLLQGHTVGIECVLQAHGGRFPISNGAADSARRPRKYTVGKLSEFAEWTYPYAELPQDLTDQVIERLVIMSTSNREKVMPAITDLLPTAVAKDMTALGIHLDQAIPRKILGGNLLIATWNLRAFASLTREWTAGVKDSPKRDLRGLLAIGEIIRRFDVIAIQEVKGDLRALRDLLRWLGDDWAFLMTDVTLGSAGNDERMAFLFDTTRLKPSGLACELVVPPEWLDEIAPDALRRQFVRTPYAVSFRSADTTFILVTLHVTFGDSAIERIPELKGIARWMREWANKTNDWSQNLIALGDFNIDRQGDPLWQAFVSTGLAAPEALNKVPRTVFSDPGKPENKFYDQIAWFQSAAGIPKLTMNFCAAGHVDFLPYVYTDMGLSKQSVSYRVSDHFPLWAEFALG